MKLAVANPTPATGQALRKVFGLLEDHFDTEAGCYNNEYSDERIAKETGISEEAVKNYRVSAFGKIKPPSEFVTLQQQLRELETLYLRMDSDFKNSIKDMQARIRILQKRFD